MTKDFVKAFDKCITTIGQSIKFGYWIKEVFRDEIISSKKNSVELVLISEKIEELLLNQQKKQEDLNNLLMEERAEYKSKKRN